LCVWHQMCVPAPLDTLKMENCVHQYVATVPNHSCVWHHMCVPAQLGGLEATAQIPHKM
jgi:hypothetical protein